MIEISKRELEELLITSFRYCLGRTTGIAADCSNRLIEHWNNINPDFQAQIQRDIKRDIKYNLAGDQCDVESWERVLKLEVKND